MQGPILQRGGGKLKGVLGLNLDDGNEKGKGKSEYSAFWVDIGTEDLTNCPFVNRDLKSEKQILKTDLGGLPNP